MKLAKFGGSSCASAEQFKKVREIVFSDPARRYVVVSAPGKRFPKDEKVTDLLYLLYEDLREGRGMERQLPKIERRYREIIDGLSLSLSLEEDFREIRERLLAGESCAYAASRGEYLKAKLMAE